MRSCIILNMNRRRARIAVTVVATLLLSGCAHAAESPPGIAGEPSEFGRRLEVSGFEDDPTGLPAGVRAYAGTDLLTVVTMGSGSCPEVAELTKIDESQSVVVLNVSTWPAEYCTADLSARTFEIPVAHDLRFFKVRVTHNRDSLD